MGYLFFKKINNIASIKRTVKKTTFFPSRGIFYLNEKTNSYKKKKTHFFFQDKLTYSNKTNESGNKTQVPRNKSFFLTWKCFAFNLALSIPILYLYILQCEKSKEKKGISKTSSENIGKPLIGGPFTLIDQDGKVITNENFKKKFCLIYFGFTYCPDICPQELEKQTIVIEKLTKKYGNIITPVFITVDPKRDTVAQIKEYCKAFSNKLVALTGTKELIKHVAKLFRVYYNVHITNVNTNETEQNKNKNTDVNSVIENNKYYYLVDHSIIHYLLDTEGKFIDFFGKNCTITEMVERISQYIEERMGSSTVPVGEVSTN
ncbi:Cg3 protein [Hepatocystis sp. ex Piliocolobus tephrosceles]|nr:Cg3 protein [Hepatocystis sp. ex Piliocolobus tephrosceles]